MSRLVGNLGIRTKLAAMLTVPLLGLFLFGALAIGEKRDAADEAAGIADLTGMSSAAAAFLHESQLERGVTSLFLNGADNAGEVKAERKATDVALTKLRAQAESTRDELDGAVGTRTRALLKAAAGLRELRRGIDAGTVPAREAIARYTAMHTIALETVGDIARRANDPSLGAQLDAYAAYLGAKESSGIERATLAGGLRAGAWPDAATLRGFVSAVALRDARLRTFELSATPADRAFAQRTVSGAQVRLAEQIEASALATLTADRLTAAAPKTWFAAQTERINRMKRVEDHLSEGVIDSASAIRDDATRAMRAYMLLMAFAVLAAIGIAVAISVQLRRAVMRVLERLHGLSERDVPSIAEGIGAMADGDLTRRAEVAAETIDRPGRDEIGRIGSAVNDIAGRTAEMADAYNASRATLAGMLSEVSDTAQTVSSASQQMAASSQETGTATDEIAHAITEMAHGAERQVQMVEAARRTADEVVESTNMSSDRAKETAARASEARTVAAEGSEAVARVTDAMRGVRESSQEATEAIRGLGAKSVEIGGIIETIRAIAEQTNLLALNAAIEAARAGEQGRGFAVVAEEVRKLAEESQDAARSIGDLVSEIQRETSTAVTVVEAGAERSEESGRIVDDARRSFDRIGEAVDGVSTQVGDIVEAAERIARAAEDMRSSMEEIAAVSEQASASTQQVSASTQETSATTQEIAQTAGSLASTAGHLEELAARFRVA